MGHRRLDPPGFLPFVQTNPAGCWPERTYKEKKGGWTGGHTLSAPLCEANQDCRIWGWFARPSCDLGRVWRRGHLSSLGVSTPRNPLCLPPELSLLPNAVGTSVLHVWRTNANPASHSIFFVSGDTLDCGPAPCSKRWNLSQK